MSSLTDTPPPLQPVAGPVTRAVVQTLDLDVPRGARIIVAMSGGVDSAVTAALCHYAGYEVVGLTMQLYDHGAAIRKKGACCAGQDIGDAREVAHRLGIPHYVLDFESAFSVAVMEDFADTYLAGATPIPCVRCNERVKFTDMLATARELGGAAMATGHYIARQTSPSGTALCRAHDLDRDQSYFLFTTTREQLDFLRFPLGGLPKSTVRDIALELDLGVADKPDSQDICFVPEGKYAGVVERLRPGAGVPGDIVHVDGTLMGQHPGVIHYTVGQRRGLGVATGEPLYVVKLDADEARVIVGPRDALLTRYIHLKDINWLGDIPFADLSPGRIHPIAVKVRSTRPPKPATLHALCTDDTKTVGMPATPDFYVELNEPEDGIAPGQACVFYEATAPHGRVLGGGWISHTA